MPQNSTTTLVVVLKVLLIFVFCACLEEVGQLLYQDATTLLNQTKPNYKKYVINVIVSLFLKTM